MEQIRNHAQYCQSGDSTLEATRRAITDCMAVEADEHFVFVVSDADLERYAITPAAWNAHLISEPKCHTFAILISQNEREGERILAGIAPGRAYVCEETDALASTFMAIFKHAVLS